MKYRMDKYHQPISILGFGCMRFTRKGSGIDIDKAEKKHNANNRQCCVNNKNAKEKSKISPY